MPSDKFTIRAVILVSAVVALASLAAMIVMALAHQRVPDNLDRAFTLSFGSLIGAIAKTSTHEEAEAPAADASPVVVPPGS